MMPLRKRRRIRVAAALLAAWPLLQCAANGQTGDAAARARLGEKYLLALETGRMPVFLRYDDYIKYAYNNQFEPVEAYRQYEAEMKIAGAKDPNPKDGDGGAFYILHDGTASHDLLSLVSNRDAGEAFLNDLTTDYTDMKFGIPIRAEVADQDKGTILVRAGKLDVTAGNGYDKYFRVDANTLLDPIVRLAWLTTWTDLYSRWETALRGPGGPNAVRDEMARLARSGRYDEPGGRVWRENVVGYYVDKDLAPKLHIENNTDGERIFSVAWQTAGGTPRGEPSRERITKGDLDFQAPYSRDDIKEGRKLQAVVKVFRSGPEYETWPVATTTVTIAGPYAKDENWAFSATDEKRILEEVAPTPLPKGEENGTLLTVEIGKDYAVFNGNADDYANGGDVKGMKQSTDGWIPVTVRLRNGEPPDGELREFARKLFKKVVERAGLTAMAETVDDAAIKIKAEPQKGQYIIVPKTTMHLGTWDEAKALLDGEDDKASLVTLLDGLIHEVPEAWKAEIGTLKDEAERIAGEKAKARQAEDTAARVQLGEEFLFALETGVNPVFLRYDEYIKYAYKNEFKPEEAYFRYKEELKLDGSDSVNDDGGTFNVFPGSPASRKLLGLVSWGDTGVVCLHEFSKGRDCISGLRKKIPIRAESPTEDKRGMKAICVCGGKLEVVNEKQYDDYFRVDANTLLDPIVRLAWLTTWADLSNRWEKARPPAGRSYLNEAALVRDDMRAIATSGRYDEPGGKEWRDRVAGYYVDKGLAPKLRIVNNTEGDRIFSVAWRPAGGKPSGSPSRKTISEKGHYLDFQAPYDRDAIVRGGGALEAVVQVFLPGHEKWPVATTTVTIAGPYANDENRAFSATDEKRILDEAASPNLPKDDGKGTLLKVEIGKNHAVFAGNADDYANGAAALKGWEQSKNGQIPVTVKLRNGEIADDKSELGKFALKLFEKTARKAGLDARIVDGAAAIWVGTKEGKYVKVPKTTMHLGTWDEAETLLAEYGNDLLDSLARAMTDWKPNIDALKGDRIRKDQNQKWTGRVNRWNETLRTPDGAAAVRDDLGLLVKDRSYGELGGDGWRDRVADYYFAKNLAPGLRIENKTGEERIFRVAWRTAGEPKEEERTIKAGAEFRIEAPYGRDDLGKWDAALEVEVKVYRPGFEKWPVAEKIAKVAGPYAKEDAETVFTADDKGILEPAPSPVLPEGDKDNTLLSVEIGKDYAVFNGNAADYANGAEALKGLTVFREGRIPVTVRLRNGAIANGRSELDEFARKLFKKVVERAGLTAMAETVDDAAIKIKAEPQKGQYIIVPKTTMHLGTWDETRDLLDGEKDVAVVAMLLDDLAEAIGDDKDLSEKIKQYRNSRKPKLAVVPLNLPSRAADNTLLTVVIGKDYAIFNGNADDYAKGAEALAGLELSKNGRIPVSVKLCNGKVVDDKSELGKFALDLFESLNFGKMASPGVEEGDATVLQVSSNATKVVKVSNVILHLGTWDEVRKVLLEDKNRATDALLVNLAATVPAWKGDIDAFKKANVPPLPDVQPVTDWAKDVASNYSRADRDRRNVGRIKSRFKKDDEKNKHNVPQKILAHIKQCQDQSCPCRDAREEYPGDFSKAALFYLLGDKKSLGNGALSKADIDKLLDMVKDVWKE